MQQSTKTLIHNFAKRGFANKKYFMVKYEYVEDAYYRRSKLFRWWCCIIVPHRETHMKQIDQLKTLAGGQTKVLGAPSFPYDGCTIFVETEGDRTEIEKFVENDPYVKNKIVAKYDIMEFEIETKRRFDRMAADFAYRSWLII